MPEVAGGLVAALFTILGMLGALFGLVGSSSKPTIQVKKSTSTTATGAPVLGKPISDKKAAAPVEIASKNEKEALEQAGVETEGLKKRTAAST